jgi:hypothetical protein
LQVSTLETEFPFRLPRGYSAPDGRVHRDGVLRLGTARDEIAVLGDPRVKANRAYAAVLLFSRVIVRLGDLAGDAITPELIEELFSADLAYLQDLYRRVTSGGEGSASCPHCGQKL